MPLRTPSGNHGSPDSRPRARRPVPRQSSGRPHRHQRAERGIARRRRRRKQPEGLRCDIGSSHFGSRLSCETPARFFLSLSFCIPCKTLLHAAQGMAHPCGGHPTHAHFRHARSRRLDQPTQLRTSQCDGVQGSSSRCQDWQFGGTRSKCVLHGSSRRVNGGAEQVVCDVESDRRGRRETSVCDRRQCEWSEAVMRESRCGFRGVRVGGASNPGPPRTRARARMEEEAEAVLSGLEAALTRIDDSSDDEPSTPTWKDEASECEEMGRREDVWARVGDVECQSSTQNHWQGQMSAVQCFLSPVGVRWRTTISTKLWSGEHCLQPTVLSHAVPAPQGVVSERVAQSVAHQGRSPVHVVRHSRETVAASPLEQVHSVVPRVIIGEVRQVVADTDRVGKAPARFCPPQTRWNLTSPHKTVQMTQPMWACQPQDGSQTGSHH